MPIRRLTLEEWFLKRQLDRIRRRHFHLPIELTVDVSRIARAYEEKGETVPYTAIVIKAAGLLARACPYVNRMCFSTFYGVRMVDFDSVRVNVPIIMDAKGRPHLSATVLGDADRLSITEIRKKIREARERDLSKLPIGKRFIENRNTWANRLYLRAIHFLVSHFPALYVSKGGGGISVSSLLNHDAPDFDARPYSYGATAFTFCVSSTVVQPDGRTMLKLGLGYDHFAFGGNEMMSALKEFSRILAAEEDALLRMFTS